jgi:hypothetical protein
MSIRNWRTLKLYLTDRYRQQASSYRGCVVRKMRPTHIV